jgi:hypothetical protein
MQVARSDPEVNLDATDGNTYTPGAYEEEALEEALSKGAEGEIKGATKDAAKKQSEPEKQPA